MIYDSQVTLFIIPCSKRFLSSIFPGPFVGKYLVANSTFKKRHYGHDHDMKEENKDETGTTLSRHIHKLRETGTNFNITWDLLEKRIAGYNPTSRQCRLCLLEKFHIMFTPGVATLNKRREIYTPCMHRDKLTLGRRKKKKTQ